LSFLELHSFAKKPALTLKNAIGSDPLSEVFNLPLSVQAFQQYQEVLEIISSLPMNDDHDSWTYIWGNSFFSSKSVYHHLIIGHPKVDQIFKWIWKSSCQPKHKVFFWLLDQDRLSTRNLLKRKNMYLPSYVL